MILFFLPDESSPIFNLLSSFHSPELSRDARCALLDRIDTHRRTDSRRENVRFRKKHWRRSNSCPSGNFLVFLCLSNNKVREKLFPTAHAGSRENANCNIEKTNRLWWAKSADSARAFPQRSIHRLSLNSNCLAHPGPPNYLDESVRQNFAETCAPSLNTRAASEFRASVYSCAVRNTNERVPRADGAQ